MCDLFSCKRIQSELTHTHTHPYLLHPLTPVRMCVEAGLLSKLADCWVNHITHCHCRPQDVANDIHIFSTELGSPCALSKIWSIRPHKYVNVCSLQEPDLWFLIWNNRQKNLTFPFRFSLQEMHFYTILPKVFNHPSRSMNSAAPITSTVTGV